MDRKKIGSLAAAIAVFVGLSLTQIVSAGGAVIAAVLVLALVHNWGNIPIPIPKGAIEAMTKFARSRREARVEMKRGQPTFCRLLQLTFVAAVVKFDYWIQDGIDNRPTVVDVFLRWPITAVGILLMIAFPLMIGYAIIRSTIDAGPAEGVIVGGAIALSLVGVVAFGAALIVFVRVLSWALVRFSSFCPVRIPNGETVQ